MIYVFKTSVKTKKGVQQLSPYLNNIRPQLRWNFDLEDCDNILRIDSLTEITESVIELMQGKGFDCKELIG